MIIQHVIEDIRLPVQLRTIAFTMVSRVHTGKFWDLKIVANMIRCACVKQFKIQSPGSFHAFQHEAQGRNNESFGIFISVLDAVCWSSPVLQFQSAVKY
jgi:hypothetical protein